MTAALRRVVLFVALPAALFLAWWYSSANSTRVYFPPLSKIMTAFKETWLGPRLREDVLPSLLRLLGGYALALVLGIALGVLIGSNRRLRSLLEPAFEFFRAIPPPVLIPGIVLLAGFDNTMKVLVILFGCIWPVLLNTVEGVRASDEVLGDTCRTYRIAGLMRLRVFVLRGASPQIVTGARQALSIAIILMVISEMFYSAGGLGNRVVRYQREFAIPEMWGGVLMLGLLGVALSLVFWLVERRVMYWYHGLRAAERDVV
jgi:ABC-type nitrate/sulfonate/bicarbonate transport system permease component